MKVEVDTDWIGAGLGVFGFLLALAWLFASIYRLIRKPFAITTAVGWETYVAAVVAIWFGVSAFRWPRTEEGSRLRKGVLLFSLLMLVSSAIPILLHWAGSSGETWRLAAGALNFTSVLLAVLVLVFLGVWFKENVRIV